MNKVKSAGAARLEGKTTKSATATSSTSSSTRSLGRRQFHLAFRSACNAPNMFFSVSWNTNM